MGQCRILRQKVKRAAGDAQEQEHELLFPAVPQLPVAPGQEDVQPDAEIGQDEPDPEDVHGMQARADEHLRAHEGHAPHEHHGQREQMIPDPTLAHRTVP